MEKTLSVSHLTVNYDEVPALQDVSTTFPPQTITAVIGASGCGKTTLLHTLNRMTECLPHASVVGEMRLGEENLRDLPLEQLRQRVGLVFQTPTPFPLSVFQNLSYVPRYQGIRDKKTLEKLAREKLDLVGLWYELDGNFRRNALTLSGGQQQRLCIARALTAKPDVLLLDEPCSALDVKSTAVIEELLLRLQASYTIIIVTHNLAQARRISQKTLFLHEGSLREEAPTDQLFLHPQVRETQDFLSGVFG